MRRRLSLPVAVVAWGAALALALPTAAHAGQFKAPPASIANAALANGQHKKPFRIRAGRIYDVVATLHGVRRGDRLELESHYLRGWHDIGSWRLKKGQHHFRGRARSSRAGLYKLRVQVLRHHGLLRGSQSNSFQVRVLGFRVPKLRRPQASAPTGKPNDVSSNWTDTVCARAGQLGAGVDIPSPLGSLTGTGKVAQVLWVRDALPGGTYGPWYYFVFPQLITPADNSETLTIGDPAAGNANSSDLDPMTLFYGTEDEYHQVAWDLALQASDGTWSWYSSDWLTPASYLQWDKSETHEFLSNSCETYAQAGR
jgi:hypothetical protein